MKTYACNIAIANSSPINANNKINGIIWKNDIRPPEISIVQEKPAIIFNNVWPEVIFANNRIDNVNTFTMYDKNSIVIIKGTMIKGTPLGKNKEKKFMPCFWIPIIFIPKKIDKDKQKVKIIWLVTVKLYGIIPKTLQKSKNKCKVKINGK